MQWGESEDERSTCALDVCALCSKEAHIKARGAVRVSTIDQRDITRQAAIVRGACKRRHGVLRVALVGYDAVGECRVEELQHGTGVSPLEEIEDVCGCMHATCACGRHARTSVVC